MLCIFPIQLPVFYRKLRGVTGYSPNEYLRVVRMKKAAELLLSEDNLTVAEVSYKVGISDPFYFSTVSYTHLVKGEVVKDRVRGLSCNMAVWWDGDLLRELLDRNMVSKYNWEKGLCRIYIMMEVSPV